MFSLAEVIDVLNRNFICLRSSRRSDGRAQSELAKLGFDWKRPHSEELIVNLNAKYAHLLRDWCCTANLRGRVVEVAPAEIPGIADWSQGRLASNYQFYLLTPNGKAVDLEFNERNPRGAEYWQVGWTSRFVMPRLLGNEKRIDWHVGRANKRAILKALSRLSKKYPGKRDRLDVPWQIDASFAVRWAKRDQKRILVVAAPKGQVDPALAKCLSSRGVLRQFHRSYSYLKLDLAKAANVPNELKGLKEGAVAICDIPSAGFTVEWRAERHPLTKVVEIAEGPHTTESLAKLLQKHAVDSDAPTWIQLSREMRGR